MIGAWIWSGRLVSFSIHLVEYLLLDSPCHSPRFLGPEVLIALPLNTSGMPIFQDSLSNALSVFPVRDKQELLLFRSAMID